MDFDIVGKLFPLSFIGSILSNNCDLFTTRIFKAVAIIILALVSVFHCKERLGDINQYKKLSLKKASFIIGVLLLVIMMASWVVERVRFLFMLLLIGLTTYMRQVMQSFKPCFKRWCVIIVHVSRTSQLCIWIMYVASMLAGSYLGVTFAIKGVSYVNIIVL